MDGSAQIQPLRTQLGLIFSVACLVVVLAYDGYFFVAPAFAQNAPPQCHVTGRLVSSEWKELGGGIERAIVRALSLPEKERVKDVSAQGERFAIQLPPGKYQLVCSAVGTRGATFKVLSKEVSVAENEDRLDIGQIDLPISKTTGLYGKSAPELTGIVAWKDTPPLALKKLRGKVVVLDFFGYYCSICHAHKPDLVKLHGKYGDRGLVVLAIHDNSLSTMDEMNAKMEPVLQRVFDGNPPKLPMALDGTGKQRVFDAYGIYAVPAVILIDQEGRVVRRYHHAGVPDLEVDVQSLLSPRSKRGR